MTNTTDVIRKRYNRTALFYDSMDKMINDELRKQVTALAYGRVLEVGVGTGNNLAFYSPDCQVTGIDFSPAMLKRAKVKAANLPNVQLLEMDIQNLAFPDNSFDTIVATCVFCSVPDPVKGLKELKRVCKPDGKIILLEHVRSSNPFLGRLMDLLNPLMVRMIGANINRRTLENIKKADISIEEVENKKIEILKFIVATPGKCCY